MISSAINLIKKCDLFGQKPKLRVDNSYAFQTKFGGLTTIIITCLSITMIIYFTINVIKRTKSNIIYSVLSTVDPPPIRLSSQNFSFSIAMEDLEYDYYIDTTIYTISGHTQYSNLVNGTWETIIVPIKFKECEFNNFPHSYHKLLPNSLNKMYCFDKSTLFDFHGTFPSGKYTEIFVYLSQCVNSTTNNFTCQSQEVINKMLNGQIVNILYTEVSIDPSNLMSPSQLLIGDLFRIVSNDYITNLYQSIKNVIIKSDYGFFSEEISEDVTFQRAETSISNVFDKKDYFLCYMIELSHSIDIYQRSYLKAQDMAAQIGGIVNFLMIFGKFLTFSINKSLYSEFLAKFLFDFEKTWSLKNGLEQISKAIDDSKSRVFDTEFRRINNFLDISKLKKSERFHSPTHNNKSVHIHICDYLRIFFCFNIKKLRSKKMNFLNETFNYIQSKLNLENLLNLYMQFEKLKYVIFDEHQLVLFNSRNKFIIEEFNFPKIIGKQVRTQEILINSVKEISKRNSDPKNINLINVLIKKENLEIF